VKVHYIFTQFPVPSETFAAVEIRALLRAGADVNVLALRRKPANYDKLMKERGLTGLRCTHNSTASTLRGLKVGLSRPLLTWWIVSVIVKHCLTKPSQLFRSIAILPRTLDLLTVVERERPAVLHLFWGHYPSLLGLLVARRVKGTLVSLFVGAYDLEMRYGGTAALARQVPVIWTHAQANIPELKKIGAPDDRIRVSYRGIEPSSVSGRTAAKKPYGILVAERLVPDKCTSDALKVFQKVKAQWPNATLLVLGDGPERLQLTKLAAELGIAGAVNFAGHVSQQEVYARMATAQVLLTMTQHTGERLPNVVKEAMASRCICVVTESIGIEELIVSGETGYVVPKGDINAAAAHIDDIFASPERTISMSSAAHAHIIAHFDIDTLIQERLAHWEKLRARMRGASCRQTRR
jgi:colanic acid/amylovoran biosynthesis glycosyltransferase